MAFLSLREKRMLNLRNLRLQIVLFMLGLNQGRVGKDYHLKCGCDTILIHRLTILLNSTLTFIIFIVILSRKLLIIILI